MPEACLSLWPTDQCEWSIIDIWRWSDLIQLSIYFGLALMLGYTFFVVIRFFRRYRLARRELCHFEPQSVTDSRRNEKALIADLSRGLGTLRGIAYAAPLLALAGTSYGILAAPSWSHPHRGNFINSLSQDFGTTLINTVFGILVAVSATLSHNLARLRAETLFGGLLPKRNSRETDLGSFQYAQTLPLERRLYGPPHFALLAATFLACPLMTYLAFSPYPMTVGLRVRLLPIAPVVAGDQSIQPPVVSVFGRPDDGPVIHVNSEEIPFDKLEEVVSQKLQGRPVREVYVEGNSSTDWADVADVIDRIKRLRCVVILLQMQPARETGCGDLRSTKHSRCRH